jgi:ectoine hydroxylase-related dioxygenase (phytanoyl-CoA dioxygenase family)
MLLNNLIVNEYKNTGVAVLRNIISKNWIKQLEIGVKKNFDNPSKYKCVYEKDTNKELFYDDYCNWQRITEYRNFFFNSGIAKIVSQLMDSKKVNVFHEHVLIKEPGSNKKTPWHQDQSYYCVNGKDNCSLWIPLDPVDKSICPEFVKGSHKWNKQFLPTKFFGDDYDHHDEEFEKIPDIEKNKKNYDIISWSLKPGDAVAFNFATVHGAPGNNSNNVRRAFSARFIGDDASFAKRKGKISPPFSEVKLNHGDKMECPTFPEIPV